MLGLDSRRLVFTLWLLRGDAADHRDSRFTQNVLDHRILEARGVVVEVESIRLFVEAKGLEPVGVYKSAELSELFGFESVLQLVRGGHVCHGRKYSSRIESATAGSPRPAKVLTRHFGYPRSRWRWRSRRALVITETELKVIAAAAMMGLRSTPKKGYKMPAAIGTPSAL